MNQRREKKKKARVDFEIERKKYFFKNKIK